MLTCLSGTGIPKLLDATADLFRRADLACLLEDVLGDELVAIGKARQAAGRLRLSRRVLLET